MKSDGEHCDNPWNRKCKNKDIVVYIRYKRRVLPICRKCWNKIAKSRQQW